MEEQKMPFKIRRIVTSHDANGKAVVGIDDTIEARPGVKDKSVGNALIWVTHSMPADVSGSEDPAAKLVDLTPAPNGTIFRVLELPPGGGKPFMHKTETIDYVIVTEGEVDMVLDDGAEVHMNTGDVMVQRATWHGWVNRSSKPCKIVFILIDAKKK
jgi:uncharacterized cupin superfamily protein